MIRCCRMDDSIFSFLPSFFTSFDLETFLDLAGQNPFAAMWIILKSGGWILLAWFAWWAGTQGYLEYIQDRFWKKKEWMLMQITVPRVSEQTCKAVENIFATVAGLHNGPSWTENWVDGFVQTIVSFEIASIDGQVSFYIWCERRFEAMLKSAIYAQYPDADIVEAENYAKAIPQNYPDEEWDVWGTELVPVAPDPFSIKTYLDFTDPVSGEFKDPLAGVLENFSHLGPGEQAWYQINVKMSDQKEFRKRAEKEINKIKGVKESAPESWVGKAFLFPLQVLNDFLKVAVGGEIFPAGEKPKEEKKDLFPKLAALSPGEKYTLECLERKAGRIGFDSKIRFIYAARKEVFKKPRAVHAFIGAIKQMNDFGAQSLKPESKVSGVSSTILWFKDARNNLRKTKLVQRYAKRSGDGVSRYFLSSEELATLWHFPILMQVKAPQLRRTEAKKTDPPSNIPFE